VPDYIAQHRDENSYFSSDHSLQIRTPVMSGTIEETACRPTTKAHGWHWNSMHQLIRTNPDSTATASAALPIVHSEKLLTSKVDAHKANNIHRNTCAYGMDQDSVESILSSTNTSECPFHCTLCTKFYGHKRGLQDHMMRTHTDKNDPVVMARNQSRKDARVKNSAKKRKDPAYVQARKDAQCKARLVKKIKKKSPNWTGVYVM
jgi:hypothetical protein